jgi:hypothetical protein
MVRGGSARHAEKVLHANIYFTQVAQGAVGANLGGFNADHKILRLLE